MTRALGIDVGGTFTDFVAIDANNRVSVHKRLTTPADPSIGVLEGTRDLAGDGRLNIADVSRIIHGTTLVANSLIERRGAVTALITTRGFRDVVELGREARYDIYDLALERPQPLVPRPLRFEVAERIRADGSVLEPLDEDAARVIAREVVRAGAESVAVVFLHAHVNPAHEQRLAAILADEAPSLDVTLSSAVAPVWREYERSSTACANAFVRPLVRRYFVRLETGFATLGAPNRLSIMLSQGGVTSPSVAAEYSVQLVESGPVGGVMAAAHFGRHAGIADLLAFDMGGTTSKVSVIENGEPLIVPEFEVARVARYKRGSGLPLLVATVELIEIGAGGGSLGHRDRLGLLKVGPESAGAQPGPACYGRGGTRATVTDADLHLGLLDHRHFLGGAMALSPENAAAALATLGAEVGLDAEHCARGIYEIVNRQMALAMRTHVVERGHDPRRFTLVATGGAGPVHAYEVARHLGIRRILYSPIAGVASALGFLVAPFSVELVRTLPMRLGRVDWAAVRERYGEMERQTSELLARTGADIAAASIERKVDMRYAGQGYEVPVMLPPGPLDGSIESELRQRFGGAYGRRFGASLESAPVEALHWRLTARVHRPEAAMAYAPPAVGREPLTGRRRVYFPEAGGALECPVFNRYGLPVGWKAAGPVVIEERETTIVVGPSAMAEVDPQGNIVVTFERLGGAR